ncbi:threonylcarbamoyl-AMP synthase [Marine Group I thaumarchaeote]|uniref:L-threonylcarbamoyladenylate synthase n=1 Tax=Marine Group I thaumarchaeote TaxID=2511932 RepID=A0A7K4P4N3_9ARCH|nr:MAG: threonylcarbamoyl-AMP synthase [Nitrosopumilus sp. YT1]NMI82176.1 threonylcarbamoyl-AMP synthase [Candidatus Nitrosopumilus sp. MTA1]NWJ20397.1 threonylcarbamoyl-AMP synthase [Marine Group I thaumarchaeote]NWJ28262.1 threonylcarbamoyl-AMP synthase [Marine Group I thaumarchaeote]NWJ56205.1 threonylcarbamoyl-AMP synthase [Marine Group I thaumarchaeote]
MVIKQKRIERMLKVTCNKEGIEKASKIINQGGIVVFPTDTVYGIGCDPYNKDSVRKIYEIKSRKISKPFPVLVYSKDIAERIAFFDEFTKKIVERFWPGPLTIILKLTDENLKESLNITDKIAIRVPNHKCTLKLLKKCNFLVGTSANISGHSSFTNPDECFNNFRKYDVFVDGGIITSKSESTIIEIENEEIRIIREGSLSHEEILEL